MAWEDLDSGSQLNPVYGPTYTDNDFNDLGVEISAESTVRTQTSSFAAIKALY